MHFDCVQDVSDAAPTVQSSYDDNVAYGVFNYEAAYKQANLLYMTEVPAYLRGRCSYKGKKPKLEVVKKCAKTGEDYKLHVFRAEYLRPGELILDGYADFHHRQERV